jgi:sporulation protein YlmC with PRC-barrel domain
MASGIMTTRFLPSATRRASAWLLLVFVSCLSAARVSAQTKSGQWDEVVGKEIRTAKGVRIGTFQDSVVDLENGRYVGMIVSYGGFAGIGEKKVIIPPGALRDDGTPHVLFLDMDEDALRNAPTFELSKEVGPPQAAKVAEVYRYFGQTPYFAAGGKAGEPLGYLRKGSSIIYLPVTNLQGVSLGYVTGLRDLNRVTGRLKGVVISPDFASAPEQRKMVPPQALRYNLKKNGLRLNDHDQPFRESSDFVMSQGGRFVEKDPSRPGVPPPPLVHGESDADKAATKKITKRIASNPKLSVYGKNVEIATLNGKTTLRGRATSAQNRDILIGYATEVAGAGNVISQIEVRPMSASEKAIDR